MSTLSISLSVICTILLISLCVSIYYNLRFGILILNLQDAIEDSLDILDEKYRKVSSIVEKPVFFDSLEIRSVISDLKSSRDAILSVASVMSKSVSQQNPQGNTTDDEEES